MGKPVGLVLMIVGLIAGPGYFIYARFYSGREITELPLEFHPGMGRRAHAIAAFDLLPVMGPVTVIVNMTATHGPVLSPPNTPQNRYRARIVLNGETVLTHSFTLRSAQVEATPAEVFKHPLPVMKNLAPGEYKLELIQEGEAEMEIRQATVQVRAGVKHVNAAVLAIGIGLLVAGAAVTLLAS